MALRDKKRKQMPLEEKVRLLFLVDILEPLSWGEIWDLARRTPDIHLDKDQTLYTPAHQGTAIFLLLKGRVRLYDTVGGREIVFSVLEAGTAFGEMALTAKRVQGVYAQALKPSEISAVSRDIIERIIKNRPDVGLKLIELLSERLLLCRNQVVDVGYKEVRGRLANLILQLVESEGVVVSERLKILTHYTHRQLGTMIGANREAVTNAFIQLRKAGAVELVHRRIHVKDIEALKRIAEGY